MLQKVCRDVEKGRENGGTTMRTLESVCCRILRSSQLCRALMDVEDVILRCKFEVRSQKEDVA